jgi:hypothetical protein
LKLAFHQIGQIDFIVASALTPSPTTEEDVDGQAVLLETIPEIIAKKIYYRASSLQSRDIFDIAAAGEQHAHLLVASLKRYPDRVAEALNTISKLNPDFVSDAIQQLTIKDRYKDVAKSALARSKGLLRACA